MNPCAASHEKTLLSSNDPSPAVVVNAASDSPIVLVCEHAGQAIPEVLGSLGLTKTHLAQHIAYDIGAENLSRILAHLINAPLILQPYSRLVIDCNRPASSPDAMPVEADGAYVAGNHKITPDHRQRRIDEIFSPFHLEVSKVLDQAPRKAVFSIHSFTPILGRKERPWDLAFLFRKDRETSHFLANEISVREPSINIGMNQPYTIEDDADWFVPFHGERRGIAHSLIEIRNDHLGNESDCKRWARLLGTAMEHFLIGGQK